MNFIEVFVLYPEGEIDSSDILSLWTEETSDFGEKQVFTITPGESNDLTQIRCPCSSVCSGKNLYPTNLREFSLLQF